MTFLSLSDAGIFKWQDCCLIKGHTCKLRFLQILLRHGICEVLCLTPLDRAPGNILVTFTNSLIVWWCHSGVMDCHEAFLKMHTTFLHLWYFHSLLLQSFIKQSLPRMHFPTQKIKFYAHTSCIQNCQNGMRTKIPMNKVNTPDMQCHVTEWFTTLPTSNAFLEQGIVFRNFWVLPLRW